MTPEADQAYCGRAPVMKRALLTLALAALLPLGCQRDQAGEGSSSTGAGRESDGLNILLISLDTTRADHLACYGHPFIETPNMDRLAEEGTLFLQCTSPIAVTLPSHSSILTGTYPVVHNARDNGTFILHEDNVTLGEALQAAGHATVGIVGTFILNREFGMAQGFDTFDDLYSGIKRVDGVLEKTERYASDVVDLSIRRLTELSKDGRPFFMFTHFYDPHQPYEPPERFLKKYMERYVGEIAYTDEELGRLFDALDDLGLTDNTLVVLTADHGEGRMQHGEETHATFLYDSTLLVPLIFRCPGLVPAGQRLTPQVRLIDIAPTILDFLGYDNLPDAQGTSLLPLITGERDNLRLEAYGESLYGMYNYGLAPLHMLREGGWKYIHAPKPELYHIAADPGELTNLIEQEPARAAEMEEKLRAMITNAPRVIQSGSAAVDVSSDAVDKLRSLGYIGGGAVAPAKEFTVEDNLALLDSDLPDPKDHVEWIDRVSHAIGMVRENAPGAEEAMIACINQAPNPDVGLNWAYKDIAKMYLDRGDLDNAVIWYRRALDADPEDGRTMVALADALVRQGHVDDAIALAEAALLTPPIFPQTHAGLGDAYLRKGDVEKAIMHFEAALEIDGNLTYVMRTLGQVYARRGAIDRAIELYEQLIVLSPEQTDWRRELAALLLLKGSDTALHHYERVLDERPNDPDALTGLGEIYRQMGRTADAIASFRAVIAARPKYAMAYDSLGLTLAEQGQLAEAIDVMRTGLEQAPRYANLANNLAWILATTPEDALRDGAEAVRLAELACETTDRRNANYLDTLAAAYAEVGRFDDAVKTVDLALTRLGQSEEHNLLRDALNANRKLYERLQPCRAQ